LNENHISVSALSSKMNKRLLRQGCGAVGPGRMEAPCVNGDADKIRSANNETVLKWQIFFLFRLHLFLRYEHSVRK
jgi:hypothetical protein